MIVFFSLIIFFGVLASWRGGVYSEGWRREGRRGDEVEVEVGKSTMKFMW